MILLTIILRSHHTVIIEIDVMIAIETDEMIEMIVIVGTAGTIVMTVEEAIVIGTEITVMIDETGAK